MTFFHIYILAIWTDLSNNIHFIIEFSELSPEITKPLSDATIMEGDVVEFTCEVSEEGATVKWFLDGKEINEDERYEILSDHNIRKLKIKDAILPDAGEIMARLEDKTTKAKLTIEGTVTYI